jgi:class 3 adenylate cyclase
VACPACGHDVRLDARFCDSCGHALVAAAPAAGLARNARAPIAYTPRHLAERVLRDGQALRGARKEVTVLFVDVQGSTELAAALDAETFHTVMDGAFQRMLDAVHRWEGTVNQFTGDGIMALFGAPIAHEDHARRALHAALELQRAFADYASALRREKGLAFQVRLGVNSGPVVVGAIGDDLRMDYTAQGVTTHLAARMQQAADPGTILVAAPTYQLTEGFFRFKPVGRIQPRGMPEAVEAYVLESEGRVASRLEASLRRGVSPFRGREAEMALLAECWERALAGQGGAVCLVGEPGIGKSRLAYEFRQRCGIAERIEGAALSHARFAAYFVFRQLLRQLAAIAPTEDMAEVRNRLHRRLWDLSPRLAERTPDIFAVLGGAEEGAHPSGSASEGRREELRNAVSAWIAAEARAAPKLLLVEDLHWLDPSSEALLARLARDAPKLPLLIVTTSRYPVAGTKLEIDGVREILLTALQTQHVHALVDSQLEPYSASDRLHGLVARRSEGNPFYVEELLRSFREHGALVLERGAYDLRADAEAIMPPTISALIASRIDRLPESAREVLAEAATLGKEFPIAHLRTLSNSPRFEDDLAQIERRGFVDRQAGAPVSSLAFRHVLTQEVAYGSLLQSDRQQRHRRAAVMLESLYGGRTDEVCDVLAHHWLLSDCPDKARPCLTAGAEAAAAMGSIREAIAHLEAALRLCADQAAQSEAAAIRLKLAGLHFMAGGE